jgi:hypothetical protein
MHRIDSTTAKANKFGAGKSGFTDGTPGVEAATETTDDWFDGVQEEIITPIEAANYTLTKGTRTQLWTAIRRAQLLAACGQPERVQQTAVFPNADLKAIACDETNKRWVAVGNAVGGDALMLCSGINVAYGDNGMFWEDVANPVNANLNGVVYNGSNLWCCVGDDDGVDAYICTSPNGNAPWTHQAPPVARLVDLNDVGYNGSNLYCAVGDAMGTDPYILTSADAATWVERTLTASVNIQLNSVAHDQSGLWVAVGEVSAGNPLIVTSTDGTTWTTRTPTVARAIALNKVRYDSQWGKWIAVGDSGAGGKSYILVSSDGTTWAEATTIPINANIFGLGISDNGIAIATGGVGDGTYSVSYILVSADGGTTWVCVPIQSDAARNITCAGYGNNQFFLGGSSGAVSAYMFRIRQSLGFFF